MSKTFFYFKADEIRKSSEHWKWWSYTDKASCKQDILHFTCDSVSVRVTQCKSVNVPFSIRKNYDKIVGISYIDPIRPIE